MPANYDDRIYDPKLEDLRTIRTGSMISAGIIDMCNIETLIDMEDEKILFAFGGDLKLYDGEIYFTTGESGFSRVDIKTGKREIIHRNIQSFSIDGNFVYYMLDSVLYRLKLDYTRELVFQDAVEIYTPEEYLYNWTVHNEYLYAYSESGLYRVRFNNVSGEKYFFIDVQKAKQ